MGMEGDATGTEDGDDGTTDDMCVVGALETVDPRPAAARLPPRRPSTMSANAANAAAASAASHEARSRVEADMVTRCSPEAARPRGGVCSSPRTGTVTGTGPSSGVCLRGCVSDGDATTA